MPAQPQPDPAQRVREAVVATFSVVQLTQAALADLPVAPNLAQTRDQHTAQQVSAAQPHRLDLIPDAVADLADHEQKLREERRRRAAELGHADRRPVAAEHRPPPDTRSER